MKRTHWLYLVLLPLLSFWLFYCADSPNKLVKSDGNVRVEYSRCNGCDSCRTAFHCPQNAIKVDHKTLTNYIDADKCVHCMKCIDIYHCPQGAITAENDLIAPGEIENLSAVSQTTGALHIQFTAPGDDGNVGRAYRYEMSLLDAQSHALNLSNYGFTVPLPEAAGAPEDWSLTGLPVGAVLTLHLRAYDEVDRGDSLQTREIIIATSDDTVPPAAITDLNATSSEDRIDLHWTAPGDDGVVGTATAYRVRYATAAITAANWESATTVSEVPVPQSAGASESMTLSGLTVGQTYYFAVRAVDEQGNLGALSNSPAAAITGDITPPSAIDDLMTGTVSATSVVLRWSAVGDNGLSGTAVSYLVRVSTQVITSSNWNSLPNYPQNLVPQAPGASETLIVTDLSPATTYYFAIEAVDDAGNVGSLSNVVSAPTGAAADTTPPAAVYDLSAAADESSILLTWTAPGDDGDQGSASLYELRYATTPITADTWSSATTLGNLPTPLPAGTMQEYSVTGLTPGQLFYFALKAYDDANNASPLSNLVNAAILTDTTPPAAVTDLTALSTSSGVVLSWTAPGDDGNDGLADHYEIRYAVSPIDASNWDVATVLMNPPAPLVAGSPQSYTAIGLTPGQTWYFALKTFDENANASPISNPVSGEITPDTTPPGTIADLAIIVGNVTNVRTIKLNWTAPGDDGTNGTVDHYEVRYSTAAITADNWSSATLFATPPTPTAPGTTQNCSVTGLTAGTHYYFAVKAFDDAGNVGAVSNSPAGHTIYQISSSCRNCGRCPGICPNDAIYYSGGRQHINADLCTTCGNCSSVCPWNYIKPYAVAD